MIVSRAATLVCAILTLLVAAHARAEDQPIRGLTIAFVERNGDGLYQASAGYAGLYRPEHFSPYPAAELAIRDGAASARARGLKLLLLRVSLAEGDDAATSLRRLLQGNAVTSAIVDLPTEEMAQLANSLANDPVVLFNPRHRDDGLRLQ